MKTISQASPHPAGCGEREARPGYDSMTGAGAPSGPDFIKALRKLER